jgi:hypothetical protein
MNSLVDFDNPFAIVGAVFLLVVVVLAVWTLLRSRRQAAEKAALAAEALPSEAELEYLDSSHIISGPLVGRDGARVVREAPAPGVKAARDKEKT